jgi:N-acetylglucosamine-6-sulfatase
MIDAVVARLTDAGVLDDTYIIYTTDNGYHIGQHRLQPGKQCPFEEDINIPLFIRGPGVTHGTTRRASNHVDLAPTIMKIAGASLPATSRVGDFDGRPIPLTREDQLADLEDGVPEHVHVEMWGIIMSEGDYGSVLYPNHTYKALRLAGDDYSFLYTVWCSGEHELYDLVVSIYLSL